MTLKAKLLGAGAALLLSAGAALAVPATAQIDLNVRAGPGTQYPVVGSIQGGEGVDVGSCTGSWCRVSFNGGSGFANRSYLAMGGGAPGPAVAAAPYVYDDGGYADYGYYDDGYAYGPSAFVYANPRFRHRQHGWNGQPGWNGGGNWAGRPGGWAGRPGGWAGRPGGASPVVGGQNRTGFAGPPANWQRQGSGFGAGAAAGGGRVGVGGGVSVPRAAAGGGGGAQPGFAGSMVRGVR